MFGALDGIILAAFVVAIGATVAAHLVKQSRSVCLSVSQGAAVMMSALALAACLIDLLVDRQRIDHMPTDLAYIVIDTLKRHMVHDAIWLAVSLAVSYLVWRPRFVSN